MITFVLVSCLDIPILDSIDKKIDLVGVFINYFFYVSFITSNLASFLVISSSSGQVCSTCIACS